MTEPLSTLFPVLNELECPVCHDYITSQIPMCVKGHSMCEPCKLRCSVCPICKGPFGDTRNYAMEKIISVMQFPCRNKIQGCVVVGNLAVILKHIEECPYGVYCCPLKEVINCPWKGQLCEVRKHLDCDLVHRSLHTPYINKSIFTATMFKSCFKSVFKIFRSYSAETGLVKWAVAFIGPKNKAKNYRFRVEFQDTTNRSCDVTFTCDCIPISAEPEPDVFTSSHVEVNISMLKSYQVQGLYEHKFNIISVDNH